MPPVTEPGLLAINSNNVYVKKDREFIFQGKVKANYNGRLLKADKISYYPKTKQLNITGDTSLQSDTIHVSSKAIRIDTQHKVLNAEDTRYLILANKGNGSAKKIYRVSNVYTELENTTYSTCPLNQKVADWQINADKIAMDHAEGFGSSKKARIKIRNATVFYLPKFSFPIDARRKSGFLVPHINYKSAGGLAAYTPWYWNIAPHMEGILTPGIIEKRGFWLGAQFSYLSHKFISRINVEGLYHDRVLANKNRYYFGLRLQNHPGSKLTYGINYSKLSDNDYINDFKRTNLDDYTDYVEQYAFINYNGGNWSLRAELQGFHSLVDNDKKYRLLPRISFSWNPLNNKYANIRLAHQYSNFEHSSAGKTTGERFNNELNLGLNFANNAFFIKPGIHIQNSIYRNLESFTSTSADMTAVAYFVDSGVHLEREFAQNRWLQTLEPRIFYVRRNEDDDEADLLNFDTSLNDFSYNQLFPHRLHSGKDLTGELNRISFGLTSKFINLADNRAHLELKLGQGYNFDTKEKTNMAFEAYLSHNAWRGGVKTYMLPDNYRLETQETSLHYQPGDKLHLKTAYKFKGDIRKELDLAGAWRINPKWLVFARSRYSLLDTENRPIENLLGFAYDSCCWAINFSLKRELVSSANAEYNNSINLSITLKGLTGKNNSLSAIAEIFE